MSASATATRRFDLEAQHAFAALSGDFNPIHVDPVAARRTLFGEPVVHGLHLVLWALDARLAAGPLPPLANMRASFKSPVLLDRDAILTWEGDTAEIATEGRLAAEITLTPGGTGAALPAPPIGPTLPVPPPTPLTAENIGSAEGSFTATLTPDRLAPLFPALAASGDAGLIAALLAATRIVGMHCPGLHSLFSELDLDLHTDGGGDSDTAENEWRCGFFHPELRLAEIEMAGGGVTGTLTAFLRPSEVRQITADEAAARLAASGRAADAYAGRHVLVVGGSRGLGEAASKLLAAGGATVTLTYARGSAEAEAVALEIGEAGGEAIAIALDITAALPPLPAGITDIAYFAAPKIRQGAAGGGFDADLFAEYCRFFVDGFVRLAAALPDAGLLYPSTVFVTEPEPRFAEYAAAKAAGEMLCAYLTAAAPGRRVTAPRLPRLATDQNAAIVGPAAGDPVAALLDIL
ncbi:MAG: SDR family NAD(P)-dependent oxidoreductase [Pseudomonadota bacterium]